MCVERSPTKNYRQLTSRGYYLCHPWRVMFFFYVSTTRAMKKKRDLDSATISTHIPTDYYHRRTLESWFSSLEQTPLNQLLKADLKNGSKTDRQR